MIKLHHGPRGQAPVWVNADLIETVEATPDTVLTLTDRPQAARVRDAGGDRRARPGVQAAARKVALTFWPMADDRTQVPYDYPERVTG